MRWETRWARAAPTWRCCGAAARTRGGRGLSRELERIDRIVRSLLDYARPQDEALGLVDTATVVRGAYVLLEAQGALKSVRAALEIVHDVPPVLGRAHLMEQSLVNLVLNAVDAAPAAAWSWARVAGPSSRTGSPQTGGRSRPVRVSAHAGATAHADRVCPRPTGGADLRG